MSPVYVIIIMWSVLFATLLRAWWNKRLNNREARSGWIQMVFATLILSLQGEIMELAIDRSFGGLPVTLYIKHFSLVFWYWLYLDIMVKAFPGKRFYRLFYGLIGACFLAGIVTVPLVASIPYGERSNARELMIGLRDALMILPVSLAFIPGTFMLAKHEKIRDSKSKLLAILTGYCTWLMFRGSARSIIM